MESVKKQSGACSSSSSFTDNLFGPKETSSSSSSSGIFSTVFGPSSTGLGRDTSHSKNTGVASKKQEFGGSYGTGKPSTPFKKDGGDTDPNGSSASRGNWWQGSLYY